MVDLLEPLAPVVRLGTATAKRTDVAQAIMARHGLADYFQVINGADPTRTTKAETIGQTLADLGDPDPNAVVMVGDRHSDIAGGRACGVRTVGVTWGYGSRAELTTADARRPDRAPARPALPGRSGRLAAGRRYFSRSRSAPRAWTATSAGRRQA